VELEAEKERAARDLTLERFVAAGYEVKSVVDVPAQLWAELGLKLMAWIEGDTVNLESASKALEKFERALGLRLTMKEREYAASQAIAAVHVEVTGGAQLAAVEADWEEGEWAEG